LCYNSNNINKTNNHLLSHTIELKKEKKQKDRDMAQYIQILARDRHTNVAG